MSATEKIANARSAKQARSKAEHVQSLFPNTRASEVSELIELVARSLRPIYPLETDCGFDELLRTLDQHGL